MGARLDHLVVAVADLGDAAARWTAAGLPAVRGGAHPVGTVNALVRGPGAAYVELIAPGSDESNPWLDRVRTARGPLSWAIAVDDVDEAHAALVAARLDPGEVRGGTRTTPTGDEVAWRMCDVGPGPYDGSLPFLIQWLSPMEPGPADGPVVEHLDVRSPDTERVADLLLALGLEPSEHWPRRAFRDASGVGITLGPPEAAPDELETGASLVLRTASGELTRVDLDGVGITLWPDRRRFAASALVPAAGSDHRSARAEAWVDTLVAAGLAVVERPDHAGERLGNVEVRRSVLLRGPAGTQAITVVWGSHPTFGDEVVVVGVGDPVVVLERQPELRTPGTAYEVGRVDDAFVQALSGGVYAVRDGRRSVVRHLDGMSSTGLFANGEAQGWLAEAEADAGTRTDGVVGGVPWL